MKLPPELRIMIWHLAAESHLRATFEIIQPTTHFGSRPAANWINGTPFRIRCPPSRRLVAQACHEAQVTLQPNPRHGFPTPIWTCMDGQRDHLMIPAGFRIPKAMGCRGVLGPARHIIVTPERTGSSFHPKLLDSLESLLLDIIASGIAIHSMSAIMDEFRVSAPFQAGLEMEFQSRFPLLINVDDDGEVSRVDRVFGTKKNPLDGLLNFSNYINTLRDRDVSWREPWRNVQVGIRRRVLRASGWDEELIESLITKRQTSGGDPRCVDAYHRLPELKRVVMLYGYWAGPDHAQVIGPSCIRSGEPGAGTWGEG
ncbi:hypothetical protein F5B21DRAFT_497402 [Xylaria acuta]|nr:hypothetical protein F5B21DRAFT_497402 [Xylaria acuta]